MPSIFPDDGFNAIHVKYGILDSAVLESNGERGGVSPLILRIMALQLSVNHQISIRALRDLARLIPQEESGGLRPMTLGMSGLALATGE